MFCDQFVASNPRAATFASEWLLDRGMALRDPQHAGAAGLHVPWGPKLHDPRPTRGPVHDQGVIGPRRQRLMQHLLITLEPRSGLLLDGLMDPDVGRSLLPSIALGLEIRVVPDVDERVALIVDQSLHLALRLGRYGRRRGP